MDVRKRDLKKKKWDSNIRNRMLCLCVLKIKRKSRSTIFPVDKIVLFCSGLSLFVTSMQSILEIKVNIIKINRE